MNHGHRDPVQRVNDKHAGELLMVTQTLAGHPEATAARAERIDSAGIDLVITTPSGPVEVRIDFTEPVSDPKWMRAAFRDLTRRATAVLAADGNKSGA